MAKCKDCGHEIAKTSWACPNCGSETPFSAVALWRAAIWLSLFVLLILVMQFCHQTPNELP